MKKPFNIVVAADDRGGIGKGGGLPWHLKTDLRHFKDLTCGGADPRAMNAVIMGRRTWDSIPRHVRPLPGRRNIVMTRQEDLGLPGAETARDLEAALALLDSDPAFRGEIFLIGGAQVYAQGLAHPRCARIYLTRVRGDFHCDCFFPQDVSAFHEISSSGPLQDEGTELSFLTLQRI